MDFAYEQYRANNIIQASPANTSTFSKEGAMRGVLLLSFQSSRLLFSSLVLLAGLAASFHAHADEHDALIARIAATGPLPCDQQAADLMNLQLEKMEPDLVLAGMRKSMNLGDAWIAGNSYYDQAHALLVASFDEDQAKNGPFFAYTPTVLVSKALSGMSNDDLQYLAQFFDKPEGKLYWEEILDGTTCANLLKKFGQAPYPALDAPVAERWEKTTAFLKGSHDRLVKRLNALPKASQASYYDGSDKMSGSVQQAPMKLINERNQELGSRLGTILKSKMDQLTPIIEGFKGPKT